MATKNTVEKTIASLPGGLTRAHLSRMLRQIDLLAGLAGNDSEASAKLQIETANALSEFADGYAKFLAK